jgi:hypothetical protein
VSLKIVGLCLRSGFGAGGRQLGVQTTFKVWSLYRYLVYVSDPDLVRGDSWEFWARVLLDGQLVKEVRSPHHPSFIIAGTEGK